MGVWESIGLGVRILGGLWAIIIGLWLLKVTAIGAARLIERMLAPTEARVLQWLQDRAMARALGVPVEIVRVRRRIETTDTPINVPDANGAKRHR